MCIYAYIHIIQTMPATKPICVYIYIYTHTYVCICMNVFIYIYIYVYVYISLSIYIYIYTSWRNLMTRGKKRNNTIPQLTFELKQSFQHLILKLLV